MMLHIPTSFTICNNWYKTDITSCPSKGQNWYKVGIPSCHTSQVLTSQVLTCQVLVWSWDWETDNWYKVGIPSCHTTSQVLTRQVLLVWSWDYLASFEGPPRQIIWYKVGIITSLRSFTNLISSFIILLGCRAHGGGRAPANHELPNQACVDTNYFI